MKNQIEENSENSHTIDETAFAIGDRICISEESKNFIITNVEYTTITIRSIKWYDYIHVFFCRIRRKIQGILKKIILGK